MIQNTTPEILAFYTTQLNQHRETGKWTLAKSAATVSATLSQMKDADGNPMTFTDNERSVIEGVLNPTSKSKIATIQLVLSRRGIEIDDALKTVIAQLFNAASVQKQIDDLANPKKVRIKDLIAG